MSRERILLKRNPHDSSIYWKNQQLQYDNLENRLQIRMDRRGRKLSGRKQRRLIRERDILKKQLAYKGSQYSRNHRNAF